MLVATPDELAVSCRLDREPVQVGRAREQARKTLPGWGLGEHADLTELIVSELVTNAMVHGDGQIEVRLSCAARGDLWVEVRDNGAGRPVRQRPGTDDEWGADAAADEQMSYRAFLAELLMAECDDAGLVTNFRLAARLRERRPASRKDWVTTLSPTETGRACIIPPDSPKTRSSACAH